MPIVKGEIQGNSIGIGEGKLTEFGADAIVVPQYKDGASYSGQNLALLQGPAKEGMKLYNAYVRTHGEQEYGTVVATPAITGFPRPILLHAVMIRPRPEAEIGRTSEFSIVKTCAYNALVEAGKRGLTSIAFPTMGADILGHLNAWQSAQAMMGAVAQHAAEGRRNLNVSFVLAPADTHAQRSFQGVLSTGGYLSADANQHGKREADLVRKSAAGIAPEVPTIKGTLIESILRGERAHRPNERGTLRQRLSNSPRNGL